MGEFAECDARVRLIEEEEVSMPFPLFHRLEQLHAEVIGQFHSEWLHGMEHVGLGTMGISTEREGLLPAPDRSVPFSYTGIDGTHFAFLQLGDQIDETTPVMVVHPGFHEARVVGEGLRDFLCLGCLQGYDTVAYYSGSPEKMDVMNRSRAANAEPGDDLEFLAVGDQVLNFLRNELSLTPWDDPVGKFTRLQEKYGNVFHRQ